VTTCERQANPDCPDLLELERRFLTYELSFVPRFANGRWTVRVFHGWLLWVAGADQFLSPQQWSLRDPLRPVANVGYLELKAIKTFLRSGPPSKARLIYLREMHDLRSTIT
jgi:hypothetical protein